MFIFNFSHCVAVMLVLLVLVCLLVHFPAIAIAIAIWIRWIDGNFVCVCVWVPLYYVYCIRIYAHCTHTQVRIVLIVWIFTLKCDLMTVLFGCVYYSDFRTLIFSCSVFISIRRYLYILRVCHFIWLYAWFLLHSTFSTFSFDLLPYFYIYKKFFFHLVCIWKWNVSYIRLLYRYDPHYPPRFAIVASSFHSR